MKLNPTNTSIIKRLLIGRNSRPLLSILNRLESADLGSLLTSLNDMECRLLLDALSSLGRTTEALREVPEHKLESILAKMEPERLTSVLVYSSEEDAAFFLSLLEEDTREGFLEKLDTPQREKIKQFLSYPEDSAGRMMQTSVFRLPSDVTAAKGLEMLRRRAQTQSIYYIYCVNPEDQLIGVISLRDLATAPAETPLHKLSKKDIVTVSPETSTEEVARSVAHYDFVAIPVVNAEQKLLGIITVDDVLDIIQEQARADFYAQAGLQEDDRVYSTAGWSVRNRLPWMFLNLILAALASSVISLFEETMSQLIVLASLKNIVAATGGNTAIQTLTVVTRGLATGDFNFTSKTKALIKETSVGVTIGVMTGLGAALLTYYWKGNFLVSCVIFIAMSLNSFIASFAGATVPILLKHLKWDPAAGSGVLVTTITDIFGFFSFLGIATLGLHWVGYF